ncbi:MAG: hypothetical protein ABI353_11505 [Isosphaeraceae bacterium]
MFHRFSNEVMPPALIAGFTTWLGHIANVPWLSVVGLAVSAGWLGLGWAKHTGWGQGRYVAPPPADAKRGV